MQSDPKHTHDHGHAHAHDPSHEHTHHHVQTSSHSIESGHQDLKSPVLMSVWHRLSYASVFMIVLWLAVLWALRTNG